MAQRAGVELSLSLVTALLKFPLEGAVSGESVSQATETAHTAPDFGGKGAPLSVELSALAGSHDQLLSAGGTLLISAPLTGWEMLGPHRGSLDNGRNGI